MSLRFVSLLAEPVHSAYAELCHLLSDSGFKVEFLELSDWREAKRMLEHKEVELAAVCGLLYTHLRAAGLNLEPIVAPILSSARYHGPVYWSDVVVRADSPHQSLSDLAKRDWLFNETGSYSGYHSPRAAFAKEGLSLGEPIETGSHAESLKRLLEGEAEFTALDSTFLDHQPEEVRKKLKVVKAVGPSPSPLVVGFGKAASDFKEACNRLAELPDLFESFAERVDSDFDPIRADFNQSLSLYEMPVAQHFVSGQNGFPSKDFTSRQQQEKDQSVLGAISRELLTRLDKEPTRVLRSGPEFHLLKENELEHHHYLIAPEELANGDLSIVGFLSNRKPGCDLKALFDVDAQLLDELSQCQGFLTYSPTEFEPGVWANLAVFRNPKSRDYWAANSTHLRAIRELGADSYDNVRLHLGVWPSTDQPLNWIATRYLNYTESGLWRGVRTSALLDRAQVGAIDPKL